MTNSTTDDEDEEKDDLLAALSTKPDFSMLLLAIESAGLRETLSGDGPPLRRHGFIKSMLLDGQAAPTPW
jgi:hypothetical protein